MDWSRHAHSRTSSSAARTKDFGGCFPRSKSIVRRGSARPSIGYGTRYVGCNTSKFGREVMRAWPSRLRNKRPGLSGRPPCKGSFFWRLATDLPHPESSPIPGSEHTPGHVLMPARTPRRCPFCTVLATRGQGNAGAVWPIGLSRW